MAISDNIPEVSDYIGYDVSTCTLYFSDGEVSVPREQISSLTILRNFRGEDFFPDFKINFRTDKDTYYRIMKDKDVLTILLKVTYFGVSPVKGEEEIRTKERIWFNDKFITYIDTNDRNLSTELTKSEIEVDNNSDAVTTANTNGYEISLNLFRESDIKTAYSVTNTIYSNADMNTIMTHLLMKSGAKNVLMSPLINQTLSEVVTLPITLMGNLNYLANQYGLHSHGSWFFFDLDTTYIMNNKPGCHVWKKNETHKKIIYVVRKDTDDKSFMGGSRMHTDMNCYVNIDPSNVSVSSMSNLDSVIDGGTIHYIQHGADSIRTIETSKKARNAHTRYQHNKYNNRYAEYAVREQRNDRNTSLSIRTLQSNITWMTPNKDYAFTFEDIKLEKELGGQYKMASIFSNIYNDGVYFRQESTIQLSKVKE